MYAPNVAANILQFPDHPLHFRVSSASSSSPSSSSEREEEEEDIFSSNQFPAYMTVNLMTPQITANQLGSRSIARTLQSKLKLFFDDLINVTPPTPPKDTDASVNGSTDLNPSLRRPRIVYVRDFNTLAASAGHWYPALLQSVRQRRVGPIARTTSPVLNPTTIIFGVTPPVIPKVRPSEENSGTGDLQSATNVLMNQRSASPSECERVGGTGGSVSGPMVGKGEWGEDEHSARAREERLKERLKKWEEDERLLLADEVPTLQSDPPPQPSGGGFPGLTGGVFGGSLGPLSGVLPGTALQALIGSPDSHSSFGPPSSSSSSVNGIGESTSPNNFFRCSVVVPSQRSTQHEKASRMSRRRRLNELTVRMAVASVGGTLPPLDVPFLESTLSQAEAEGIPLAERADLVRMWDVWGPVVVVWRVVKQVADRALGSILIAEQEHDLRGQRQSQSQRTAKLTLNPTVVPWSAIARALLTKASASAMRKHWAKEIIETGEGDDSKESEGGVNVDGRRGREKETDEVIERVKRDTDLDEHEQRLLGCIVDPRKSNTGVVPCPSTRVG